MSPPWRFRFGERAVTTAMLTRPTAPPAPRAFLLPCVDGGLYLLTPLPSALAPLLQKLEHGVTEDYERELVIVEGAMQEDCRAVVVYVRLLLLLMLTMMIVLLLTRMLSVAVSLLKCRV